jgi:hypothetical protein
MRSVERVPVVRTSGSPWDSVAVNSLFLVDVSAKRVPALCRKMSGRGGRSAPGGIVSVDGS